jgi:hypothetical protein
MNALVIGTFEAENQAVQAVRKLVRSCVPSDSVRTIFPGARKRLAAHRAQGGADPKEPGGILVSVRAPEYVAQRLAVKIMRDHGARDIANVNAERRAKPRPRVHQALPSVQYPLPL